MLKKIYFCDCASLSVECGGSIIDFHNGLGDGSYKVYVFESEKEFQKWVGDNLFKKHYHFITSCYFKNAGVLNYDCLKNKDIIQDENVLFTLNGTYAILNNDGDMYLVKWEE